MKLVKNTRYLFLQQQSTWRRCVTFSKCSLMTTKELNDILVSLRCIIQVGSLTQCYRTKLAEKWLVMGGQPRQATEWPCSSFQVRELISGEGGRWTSCHAVAPLHHWDAVCLRGLPAASMGRSAAHINRSLGGGKDCSFGQHYMYLEADTSYCFHKVSSIDFHRKRGKSVWKTGSSSQKQKTVTEH